MSHKSYASPDRVQACLDAMADQLRSQLRARSLSDPLMVGIHTGGVWVAEQLHPRLALQEPLGKLDISFYRDDFTRIGLHPQVHPSDLPVTLDDRAVILVDDVLHTGRTIRAALNNLFDYGRPAAVLLAVLVARNGRELPIAPDVAGFHLQLLPSTHVKLSGPDPLELFLVQPD